MLWLRSGYYGIPLVYLLHLQLISVNQPDLVLFVGEALVGNEAVDQLKQFNRALRDHHEGGGAASDTPIDGILLTKFDTIDDKVTIATVVFNNFIQ